MTRNEAQRGRWTFYKAIVIYSQKAPVIDAEKDVRSTYILAYIEKTFAINMLHKKIYTVRKLEVEKSL